MGRLGCFLFGLLVGATTVFVSLKYHVVRAADGHHLVPKITAELRNTYVDIRSFGISEWSQQQTLAAAIAKSGKSHLLAETTMDHVSDKLNDYLDVQLGQPGSRR